MGALANPWLDHTGKGRPHPPLTYVEVRFRNGKTERGTSGFLNWVWNAKEDDLDVMAWRRVPEPPSKDAIIAALVVAGEELANTADSKLATVRETVAAVNKMRAALKLARGESS